MNWLPNWINQRKIYSPSTSVDETNGLVFNDVVIPEEIVLLILSYLDMKSVLKCKQVCKTWDGIIKSHHFWRVKLAHKNKIFRSKHPWYTYFICYSIFDRNLLKNGNGEEKTLHWKDVQDGGDGWVVENPPVGADPLPEHPDFNNNKSCFATSYQYCCKRQVYKFKNNTLLREVLDRFQPKIYVSEWYAGRFDCGCIYKLGVKLYDSKHKVVFEKEEDRTIQQFAGKAWEKVEIICENYGEDVCAIELYHVGSDTQFWKGHYGSKMAGGVIKISSDFI